MKTWKIDPDHSDIQFKVKHMMVSTVTGKFDEFQATAETEEDDFTHAKISFVARIDSVNTGNPQRDEHLKSDDFFNAASFPELRFEGTGLEPKGENEFILKGNLTIREHTHPIELHTVFNGTMVDPYGQTKAGFEITGKVSRKSYGLKWNAVTEAGGVVVSDEVRLVLDVQMTAQG